MNFPSNSRSSQVFRWVDRTLLQSKFLASNIIPATALLVEMELYTLLASLLLTVTVIEATPIRNQTEDAASRQIDTWQKQSQRYIEKTLENRHSGCTPDKIVHRREW